MQRETTGTVAAVSKQWWLKVNRRPARRTALDGAEFPHVIKVQYTVDGKDYMCRKWIGAGGGVPAEGSRVTVLYREDRPSRASVPL